MKILNSVLMTGLAMFALSSCGGSNGSSNGMFGNIPETIEKYEQKKKELNDGLNESNYQKNLAKIDELKAETIAKLEKEGEDLNGKEFPVSVNENELKIETPLTLVYKNVFSTAAAVDFKFEGQIVAATDLKLEISPSELKGRELLGGASTVVTVKLPVQIELLDKDGNVVNTRTLGNLIADNNGEESIVKAGTPINWDGDLPVSDKFVDVASARLIVDLTKGLTSETMQ